MSDRVVLKKDGARRIIKATRDFEKKPKGQVKPPIGARTLEPVRWAIVKTPIKARSGRVKGTGTVTLLVDDQTGTGTDIPLEGGDGVTVWNGFATQIDPGSGSNERRIQVRTIDGLLQVISADCPL